MISLLSSIFLHIKLSAKFTCFLNSSIFLLWLGIYFTNHKSSICFNGKHYTLLLCKISSTKSVCRPCFSGFIENSFRPFNSGKFGCLEGQGFTAWNTDKPCYKKPYHLKHVLLITAQLQGGTVFLSVQDSIGQSQFTWDPSDMFKPVNLGPPTPSPPPTPLPTYPHPTDMFKLHIFKLVLCREWTVGVRLKGLFVDLDVFWNVLIAQKYRKRTTD